MRRVWSASPDQRDFFNGATNCLSALIAAHRDDDVLALLELSPYKLWHYRQPGVAALEEEDANTWDTPSRAR
ncbi:hypothetical protein [Myxococcus xanthus]|uniref:Uncharacterized protein n=1 Tax=Myxococcus xanthus TaxID=34 RepID=A0A7Y4INJ4_MYXXA|nr:hypothetical protein [Myxococcus xanthus]NOJ82547.1 hypothetical protein [Myxococcus xanthus]NOJ89968.1 hypothetical protein [Myxococcus xanthus]